MKPSLFLSFAAALLACPCTGAAEHQHAPGEACAHDHAAHQHAEGEACAHDHAAHQHAEGESCAHDHAAHQHAEGESCAHDHAAHQHAEGEACAHDHAAHQHAEGESCAHDHAAHSHAPGESCSGGHSHGPGEACSGGGDVVIVTADPHSRHLVALQVEAVPAPGSALSSSLYGTLTAPDHALQTYALPAAGRITLHVKSAQQVHAGTLLYTVESPALSDQLSAIRQAEANIARCRDEIDALTVRIERLGSADTRNSELESQRSFKQAEERQLARDLETARARLRMLTLGAELHEVDGLPRLLVKADKAGIVRNVGVPQGSWGEQGAAVITMSDPDALEIVASLYASDMPAFTGVRALIPIGRENMAVAGEWRLAEQVDPQKQTRSLYFTPEKLPQGARPGQLCRLDLYDDNAACGNTISIPDSAIVRVGMDDMVFVELGEGRYAGIKVHAGESRRGMTPVSGLTPGQRIVVKGGYELKYILPGDGQKKAAGHFHADGKFHEGEHH